VSLQDWNPSLYDRQHAFVFEHGKSLLELLDPQPGERILDIGCGTGHLTKAIAEAGAQVVGMDNAPAMIAGARAAYPELTWQLADVRAFSVAEPFDAIFSNAALHWVPAAETGAALDCIAQALKPGGRLVLEMGGRGNVATLLQAVSAALWELLQERPPQLWFFPSIGEYAALLEDRGLEVRAAWLFERPTPLENGEHGLRVWLAMFGSGLLASVPAAQREEVMARIEALARPRLFDVTRGRWILDYRRLRLLARKS
jgi:trans-aconitate methyltransferase